MICIHFYTAKILPNNTVQIIVFAGKKVFFVNFSYRFKIRR